MDIQPRRIWIWHSPTSTMIGLKESLCELIEKVKPTEIFCDRYEPLDTIIRDLENKYPNVVIRDFGFKEKTNIDPFDESRETSEVLSSAVRDMVNSFSDEKAQNCVVLIPALEDVIRIYDPETQKIHTRILSPKEKLELYKAMQPDAVDGSDQEKSDKHLPLNRSTIIHVIDNVALGINPGLVCMLQPPEFGIVRDDNSHEEKWRRVLNTSSGIVTNDEETPKPSTE